MRVGRLHSCVLVAIARKITHMAVVLCVPASLVFLSVPPAHADPLFNTRIDYDVWENTLSMTLADLNGDDIPDVAVAKNVYGVGSDVVVMLGNGDGTFLSGSSQSLTYYPRYMTGGDLNGDATPDLVVSSHNNNYLSVLIGNGDGTFQPEVIYDVGYAPYGAVVGDVNGDDAPDVAVAMMYTAQVAVLLNNGDGSLSTPVPYAVGSYPFALALGELNGDAAPDLVVANSSSSNVSVLLGNGDGTFQPQVAYATGTNPQNVAVCDLDGDLALDLAVADQDDDHVSVLLGNGDGTFQPAVPHPAGVAPHALAADDLDGDGVPDLAVATSGHAGTWEDSVSVLLGNGDGTLQAPEEYDTLYGPWELAAGDLDGDDAPDLVVLTWASDALTVLLQATVCVDMDEDGYGVQNTDLCPYPDLDCDDEDPDVNPGTAEICGNSIDDDCDGLTDYDDPDCCFPEVCDNLIDDDCDGLVDSEDPDCPCADGDGDGYGDPVNPVCTYPELDCDDTDPAVNPGASEVCDNGLDDDCDGLTDHEDDDCPCLDGDGDGYGNPVNANCTYPEPDCDDTDPDIHPGATEGPLGDPTCSDTLDNDCDGLVDGDEPICSVTGDWFVPDTPGCGTIQGCIDQAVDGKTIRVLPGTYPGSIDFLGKAITVRSEDGPETTIVEGNGNPVVTFDDGEGSNSILEGLTLTGGEGRPLGGEVYNAGGGILIQNSSPRILGCVVRQCTGGHGAGIYIENGSPEISSCTVADNTLVEWSSFGGGIYINGGAPVVTGSTIVGNGAEFFIDGAAGGGICVDGGSPTISGCLIRGNSTRAHYGGAGGGIAIHPWTAGSATVTIENCIVAENETGGFYGVSPGGGIAAGGTTSIVHCTIAANTAVSYDGEDGKGGGVFVGSGITEMIDSIVYGNSTPDGTLVGVDVAVGHGVLSRGARGELQRRGRRTDTGKGGSNGTLDWGDGNIQATPALTADYHLGSLSPCIDQGTDAGVTVDIDGEPRPQGDGFDMGADETVPSEPWAAAPEARAAVAAAGGSSASPVANGLLLIVPVGIAVGLRRRRGLGRSRRGEV